MRGLIKSIGAVKLILAATILTTVVAAAASVHATLPSQAATGQDHAATGAANGQDHAAAGAANGQSADTAGQGLDLQAVTDRLAENQARLLTNLNDVLARLQDSNANQHALDAVQAAIDRLTNENIGLNRASDAVTAHGAASGELPEAATNHPTSDNHPGRP
jgi:hypothetical protein